MRITLNLLPPVKKEALRLGLVLAYAQTMVFLFFIVTVFAAVALVYVKIMVSDIGRDLERQSASLGGEETAAVTSDIKQINDFLNDVDKLEKQFEPWSVFFERLTPLIPPGTQLTRIRIDESGRIFLSGVAPTRNDALELLRRLKEAPFVTDVVSPLSNILQKQQVNFDFEMKYVRPEAGN